MIETKELVANDSELLYHIEGMEAYIVRESADPDANIIFGAVIDETLNDEIRITVIATGFEDKGAEGENEEINIKEVVSRVKKEFEKNGLKLK